MLALSLREFCLTVLSYCFSFFFYTSDFDLGVKTEHARLADYECALITLPKDKENKAGFQQSAQISAGHRNWDDAGNHHRERLLTRLIGQIES